MQIILGKYRDKPATLSCVRDDGSVTWQNYGNQSGFFPVHDLTHFAVETLLGYGHAFFGMIAAGRDINDFGPGDAVMLPPEAVYAEMLAGLLTTAEGNGSVLTCCEIKNAIDSKTQEAGMPVITLTEEQLMGIRQYARELTCAWQNLPFGEKLTLSFEQN